MSEQLDIWSEYRLEMQKKRASNVANSFRILASHQVNYQVLNSENNHLRIGDYDMWLSTGKFINRKTNKSGRGIFNLLREINHGK